MLVKQTPACIRCLAERQLARCPSDSPPALQTEFMRRTLKIIADAPLYASAPELVAEIDAVRVELFGSLEDYSSVKSHFNRLMLSLEPELWRTICDSSDPLGTALGLSMTGNYIDFGAMHSVDEHKLRELLAKAPKAAFDAAALESLRNELSASKHMAFLTDNCGEIVLDKLLISTIRRMFPALEITAIVRGANAVNDATLEDAAEVGLDKLVPVIGNGSNIAGTCIDSLSAEARRTLDDADLIIAKGQGNFETLYGCQKNIYYIFMCKCQMFADRFGVERFQGMLLRERGLKKFIE